MVRAVSAGLTAVEALNGAATVEILAVLVRRRFTWIAADRLLES
jgi:hypothetical protein